jgi:hypothetical protein
MGRKISPAPNFPLGGTEQYTLYFRFRVADTKYFTSGPASTPRKLKCIYDYS